ncbi:MAG: orotidine-5'-phosphate decarboxylase [Oscillospiraceae bacterium]|jgi:orotidine-5'-phosphate decarboxylase|nr:orotidine-5'-phosphate decarboxylase [Oscillospiraceae bacterium]
MSFEKLQDRINELRNPTVAGLDPTAALMPPALIRGAEDTAELYEKYCAAIIDAVCDVVPAVKPQSAFFETLGARGSETLFAVARYAKSRGLYVILDAKRGDIGSTASAYAEAYLSEDAPFDCITVNGYLGSDGIAPFFETARRTDKSLFVLVKTSNPSSGEVQDLDAGGAKVYRRVADAAQLTARGETDKYGYTRVGFVAGATYPAELAEIRGAYPAAFLLVPGYGAQGGGAESVAAAFDARGGGAVVNSSRAILGAWKKSGGDGARFAEDARREALAMRDALRAAANL